MLELVEAWRRAEARLFDWRLVIAGWGEGRFVSELMSQTAQCQAITFVGPVHGVEKSSLLASSHAFILPSHSEGLPMAVLEAWAAGLPVFMTRACNLPEGFAAGAAIEISCDPDEMAEQLVRGLRERSLRSIGTRGRKLVADRFTWKAIGVAHIEVYNWMCRGGPPPRVVVPPQGLGGSNRVPAPG